MQAEKKKENTTAKKSESILLCEYTLRDGDLPAKSRLRIQSTACSVQGA